LQVALSAKLEFGLITKYYCTARRNSPLLQKASTFTGTQQWPAGDFQPLIFGNSALLVFRCDCRESTSPAATPSPLPSALRVCRAARKRLERRGEESRTEQIQHNRLLSTVHTYIQTNTQTPDKNPDLQTLFALRRCNSLAGPALFNVNRQRRSSQHQQDQQQDPRASHLSSQQRGWFPLPTTPFALLLGFPGSLAALHRGHSFSTRRTLRPSVREGAGGRSRSRSSFWREERNNRGRAWLRSLCLWHR
jgi:hypothetical protein